MVSFRSIGSCKLKRDRKCSKLIKRSRKSNQVENRRSRRLILQEPFFRESLFLLGWEEILSKDPRGKRGNFENLPKTHQSRGFPEILSKCCLDNSTGLDGVVAFGISIVVVAVAVAAAAAEVA